MYFMFMSHPPSTTVLGVFRFIPNNLGIKKLSIHELNSYILSKLTVTLMGFKPMTFRTGI